MRIRLRIDHAKPMSSGMSNLFQNPNKHAITRYEIRTRSESPKIPQVLRLALNCGIGSSSLNADVNAFDRLQIVRD